MPRPDVKFKGRFPEGEIVFHISDQGDAVINLRVKVRCFEKEHELNLSRASIKITNGYFVYGFEEHFVEGRFLSSNYANGVFSYEVTKGDKVCNYDYVSWTATSK